MKFHDAAKTAENFERRLARKLNTAKGLNKRTRDAKKKLNPDDFLPDFTKRR